MTVADDEFIGIERSIEGKEYLLTIVWGALLVSIALIIITITIENLGSFYEKWFQKNGFRLDGQS